MQDLLHHLTSQHTLGLLLFTHFRPTTEAPLESTQLSYSSNINHLLLDMKNSLLTSAITLSVSLSGAM